MSIAVNGVNSSYSSYKIKEFGRYLEKLLILYSIFVQQILVPPEESLFELKLSGFRELVRSSLCCAAYAPLNLDCSNDVMQWWSEQEVKPCGFLTLREAILS